MKIMIFKSPYFCHADINFPIIVEAKVRKMPNFTIIADVSADEFEKIAPGCPNSGVISFLFESNLSNSEFKIMY